MNFKFKNKQIVVIIQKKIFYIMRNGILLTFIFAWNMSASVFSQIVHFDRTNQEISIKEVMQIIENQTDYTFFYNDAFLDLNRSVKVNRSAIEVGALLNEILKDTELTYREQNDKFIVITPKSLLQGITITGTVSEADGEPIPGVSVIIKGTSTGTATDANGRYSISVPNNNAVLQFSYLGFETVDFTVGSQTLVNVTLHEKVSQLAEVVVVGYGSVKKANLTGAVAQISGKELENRSVPSITQALQGKIAGVNIATTNGQPGAVQNINIRGYTGLGSTAAPLIVIDGVQGGDLATLEMNDVESISFLKDAASAAIYGSSAPYGVIIITTKRGQSGKPVISYNNNISFARQSVMPKFANAVDFAHTINEVHRNGNGTDEFNAMAIQRYQDYLDGILTEKYFANPTSDAWSSGWESVDWFDVFFNKTAISQQHNISASGSSESCNYYIGLGYTEQDGVLNFADDVFQRYNARVNVSTNLTKWLSFGLRGTFARRFVSTPNTDAMATDMSWVSSSYGNVLIYQIARSGPTGAVNPGPGNTTDYIGMLQNGGRNKNTNDNALLTGEFILHPLPGWDITANFTYNGVYIDNSRLRRIWYNYRPSGTPIILGRDPDYFERTMDKNQRYAVNAFTSYEKTLGGDHYFKALAGFSQELIDNLSFSGSNTNLYNADLPSLTLTQGTNRSVSDAASQLAIRGFFGRINYSYREKYLLELNGRYDGTSRFMKDRRMKFYPGASAAWVASKESFWNPLEKYVNQFKLRASYASLGDSNFTSAYYPFYPNLGVTVPTGTRWLFNSGREATFSQPGMVNYNLTWVTAVTTGFGVDVGLLNNRFNFSYDWYRRYAKDYAGPPATYPAIMGVSAPNENNAAIETKGFEITLGWKDRIQEFSYGANFVLSDYKGKIIKYEGNSTRLISTWYAGQTMGEIWGYETVGLFKSQDEINATNQSLLSANWYPGDVHYKDINGNGQLDRGNETVDDPGDRIVIGNNTPRYSFGLTLNAEWKGFDATAFLQGVGKRDIMFAQDANMFWGVTGWGRWQSSIFTVHQDRWTEDNPNGYYPRWYFNTYKNSQPQTRYLQNAAYMRIKNVQLGYTIPKNITNKIKFQRIRIFVNAENLATYTKLMKVIDPEIVDSQGRSYPLQRAYAFGINITF